MTRRASAKSVYGLFGDTGATISGDDQPVRALVYDSRRVTKGSCFAALRGISSDGHTFVQKAIRLGATSLLVEKPVERGKATVVAVDDSRKALAQAARRFYGDPSAALCMVGITGTNGKTSTSFLVRSILEAARKRTGVMGTLGVFFGKSHTVTGLTTPESVDVVAHLAGLVKKGAKAVCMEVSSHALVQQRVAGVDFDVAVFTNLTHDHLDYHGTMESYFQAKAQLFGQRCKPKAHAVLNIDDLYAQRLVTPASITYSVRGNSSATVRVLAVSLSAQGLRVVVKTPRGTLMLRSPLVGRFNIENIVAAVAVGEALGLPLAVIQKGIAQQSTVPGRMQRISSKPSEPLVVVDYAHSPDALDKVLTTVRELVSGRLLVVFGCGGNRDPFKRPLMGEVVGRRADVAVLTNDNPRDERPEAIADAVETGLVSSGCARLLPGTLGGEASPRGFVRELDRKGAIVLALSLARPGDAVVLAGKGHETYQIIGKTTRHFDDSKIAREALNRKKSYKQSPKKKSRLKLPAVGVRRAGSDE